MKLQDYISEPGLRIYTEILKLKPDQVMAGYNWNKALGSSIQPLFHCLEVSLRNAIDHTIRNHPPPGAEGLWRTDSNWIFDLPRYMGDKVWIRQGKRFQLDAQGNRRYSQGSPLYQKTVWEEECIRKVAKRIKMAGKIVTAERVISGLDFGFWTHFLSSAYDEPRNRSLLWPNLTGHVFPGAPAGMPRHIVDKKFNLIRDLRNRLAHHEAVWKFYEMDETGKRDYTRPVYGLNASLNLLHRAWNDMFEGLLWVSPVRYHAFRQQGHHRRFEALASKKGISEFLAAERCGHAANTH